MHVHVRDNVDCDTGIEDIIEEERAKGIDALCVTSHDSFIPATVAKEVGKKMSFTLFVGCEYSSIEGHLLIYGINDENFVKRELMSAQYVIDCVSERGGVVVPSHPYSLSNSFVLGDKLFDLKGLFAIETINGGRSLEENNRAENAAKIGSLNGTGGSDGHFRGMYGNAYTVFDNEIKSDEDLVREIKNGKYHAERRINSLRFSSYPFRLEC